MLAVEQLTDQRARLTNNLVCNGCCIPLPPGCRKLVLQSLHALAKLCHALVQEWDVRRIGQEKVPRRSPHVSLGLRKFSFEALLSPIIGSRF